MSLFLTRCCACLYLYSFLYLYFSKIYPMVVWEMRRSRVFWKCSIVVFPTNASETLSVFLYLFVSFLYLFVYLFVFLGDQEKRSVFEMFNRCFSNKCFRDTVRKVNIAHGTSPSVGMRMVWKTI